MDLRSSRKGISIIVIILALVIVVVIGGSAYYFLALGGTGGSTTTTRTTQTGTHSVSTTGGQLGYKTYSGTYSYTDPLGPGGDRYNNQTNMVDVYKSVQTASGTFTFFVNPANYTGTGTGQGTFTITTTGFCSGSVTFHYTFRIIVTHVVGENLTIGFEDPTPAQYMVSLSCTGSLDGVDTAVNNPAAYLSVYPNLVTTATMPVNISQQLAGGISYQYSIAATN